jgi:hypothetical protein
VSRFAAAFVWVALVGCGSSDSSEGAAAPKAAPEAPKAAPAPPKAAAHGGDSVEAFHSALRPLWHAAPGPQRTADTCTAVPKLRDLAVAMKGAPPAGAKPMFPEQATGLVSAIAGLEKECATPDRPGFDAAFHGVHEAFHGVAEACDE